MKTKKSKAMVYKYSQMGIFTSEDINKGLPRDMGSITGIVEHFTEEPFCQACGMEKESG